MAKPIKKYKSRGISISVFNNEGKEDRSFHSFQVQKSFKVNDNWKNVAITLGTNDLQALSLLINRVLDDELVTTSENEIEGN
jgi:hypothetical protein